MIKQHTTLMGTENEVMSEVKAEGGECSEESYMVHGEKRLGISHYLLNIYTHFAACLQYNCTFTQYHNVIPCYELCSVVLACSLFLMPSS